MMYKYEHGGDIYTEKLTKDGRPFVDYSANINPLGLPLGIKPVSYTHLDVYKRQRSRS